MDWQCYELHGIRVLEFPQDGSRIRSADDVTGFLEAAFENGATVVVIPVSRLDPDFFRLSTRVAGEVLQKFVTYHRRVVVAGDISEYLHESQRLREFVEECNRGAHIWFLPTLDDLPQKLAFAVPSHSY